MPTFAYRILPPRPEFWDTLGPGELALMARHFEHLRRLKEDGVVRYAGRTETGGYGFVVIEAATLAKAEAIARSDPAVSEGLMGLELHPFVVAFDGQDDAGPPPLSSPPGLG